MALELAIAARAPLERTSLDEAQARGEWDRFVRGRPDATPFHLTAWIGCLCRTYGHRASLFVLRDTGGEIAAVLPFVTMRYPLRPPRHVSLPFSDYGGVLARDGETADQAVEQMQRMHEGLKGRLEMRGAVPEGLHWKGHTAYVRHTLDLRPGLDQVARRIDRRTIQYSIRKAEKSGVTIEEASGEEALRQFYRLNLLTRAKHGVPSQPLRFFRGLLDGLAPAATPSILLARDGTRAIAAGFFIEFNRALYFKYSASDPECLVSKTPNHLLTWHAIQAACARGLQEFDFGRSSTANEGLCRYKRMWGARESALPYSYYPDGAAPAARREAGAAYDLLTSLWRRLPGAAQARIGPLVYRYLG